MSRVASPAGIGFELGTKTIALSAIIPLKSLQPSTKQSQKYRQVAASIRAVGLVEAPVVAPNSAKNGTYLLLDGLLRIEAIKELGWSEVDCLISTDDEAYSYNKRISRLAAVQEHRMIVRAIERGVSEEQIAKALNLDAGTVHRRFRMLDGICPEAVDLLSDQPCPMVVFNMLKRMRPMRQIEAAELMVGQRNFSSAFVRAILAATPREQLLVRRRTRVEKDVSREQIARLERELQFAQSRTKYVEDTYGEDNLQLTIAKSYLAKLLKNDQIRSWLGRNEPEYLAEFTDVAELDSLMQAAQGPAA